MEPYQYSNQRPLKGLSIKVIIGMLIFGLIILAFSAQAAEQKENAELKTENTHLSHQFAGTMQGISA